MAFVLKALDRLKGKTTRTSTILVVVQFMLMKLDYAKSWEKINKKVLKSTTMFKQE